MVALMDCLQEGGPVMAAAVRVLEAMIIDNRRLLRAQIKGLPPIPKSVPALGRVVDVIEQERGKLTSAEMVQLLLQSLSHHSLSVRAAALEVIRLANICGPMEGAPFCTVGALAWPLLSVSLLHD